MNPHLNKNLYTSDLNLIAKLNNFLGFPPKSLSRQIYWNLSGSSSAHQAHQEKMDLNSLIMNSTTWPWQTILAAKVTSLLFDSGHRSVGPKTIARACGCIRFEVPCSIILKFNIHSVILGEKKYETHDLCMRKSLARSNIFK